MTGKKVIVFLTEGAEEMEFTITGNFFLVGKQVHTEKKIKIVKYH